MSADRVATLFENVPHMLPGIAILLRCGMKAGFRHDDRQHDAAQQDSKRADADWKCSIVGANQQRGSQGNQPCKSTQSCSAKEQLVRTLFSDFICDPGLFGTADEGISHAPDDRS